MQGVDEVIVYMQRVQSGGRVAYCLSLTGRIACKDGSLSDAFPGSWTPLSTFYKLLEIGRTGGNVRRDAVRGSRSAVLCLFSILHWHFRAKISCTTTLRTLKRRKTTGACQSGKHPQVMTEPTAGHDSSKKHCLSMRYGK